MELIEVVRRRRSIRRYKPDPVAQDHIVWVLAAVRLAPSWANSQCRRFVMVSDLATKQAFAKSGQ